MPQQEGLYSAQLPFTCVYDNTISCVCPSRCHSTHKLRPTSMLHSRRKKKNGEKKRVMLVDFLLSKRRLRSAKSVCSAMKWSV